MANVTEKDIVNHLKEKIKYHQAEAKIHQDEAARIEGLLNAFNGNSSTARGRKAKIDAVDEALSVDGISAAPEKKKRGPKKSTSGPKPLQVPEKYTEDLTINSRIAFALNEIGSGFNEQIAEAMAQYEPKSDAQKISRQISGVLSTLKSKGLLTAEKVGRKDRFSLAQL